MVINCVCRAFIKELTDSSTYSRAGITAIAVIAGIAVIAVMAGINFYALLGRLPLPTFPCEK